VLQVAALAGHFWELPAASMSFQFQLLAEFFNELICAKYATAISWHDDAPRYQPFNAFRVANG
jgi:hypothetical protein